MSGAACRYRIGIDENGLGPRLGPMIVTGVLARLAPGAERVVGRKPRGALAERLGDSKALVAHGDVALGEAWARALAARGCARPGAPFEDPDALVHAVAADERATLRARCPSHVEAQCWGATTDAFAADDALVRTVARDLDRLAGKGVDVVAVRSVILCAKRMNDELDAGRNRFVADLHAMERLVLDFRAIAGEDVRAVCGKVGGFGRYEDVFGPLGGRLMVTLEESRARSAYHVPGVGEIAFVRDADATDLCVAMASMVGKWVREALMGRIVEHYRASDPELPDASGYHDPVTDTFIHATRLARRKRKVPAECFERRSAGDQRPTAKAKAKKATEPAPEGAR